ncbi:MAG: Ig-like domain-containing protein [Planctomycetes bacterium]|nr:Ig-like domain-containing protein [Planctomycetota bacterium]
MPLLAWFLLGAGCSSGGSVAGLAVSSVEPADGAVLASPPVVVRTRLSQAIDAASVTSTTLQVVVDGMPKVGAVGVDPAAANVLVFAPTTPFTPGTTVEVVVAGTLRAADGRVLGADRRSTFSIAPSSAVPQLQVGTTQSVWSGSMQVQLAPLARTSADELGAAFWQDGSGQDTYAGAFWNQTSNAWSGIAATTSVFGVLGGESLCTGPDGVGGLLMVNRDRTVHHGRDLASTFALVLATDTYLHRFGAGPTTIWPASGLHPGLPSSFDWVPTSRTFLPNATTTIAAEHDHVVGLVPWDADRAQVLHFEPTPGDASRVDLFAQTRDRFGVTGPEVLLGRFAVLPQFAMATTAAGRTLLAVLEPSPFGATVSAVDFVVGQGWSTVTQIGTVPDAANSIVAAVAGDGSAVIVTHNLDNRIQLATRDGGGEWLVTEAQGQSHGLPAAAVAEDGTALVARLVGGDGLLVGRRSGGAWSEPLSLRSLGQVPSPLQGGLLSCRIASTAGSEFLLLEQVFVANPSGPQFHVQSVLVTLQ